MAATPTTSIVNFAAESGGREGTMKGALTRPGPLLSYRRSRGAAPLRSTLPLASSNSVTPSTSVRRATWGEGPWEAGITPIREGALRVQGLTEKRAVSP